LQERGVTFTDFGTHGKESTDYPDYAQLVSHMVAAHKAQYARYQDALRLVGYRGHAEPDADYGVPSDDDLHGDLVGLTPMTAPRVTTRVHVGHDERICVNRSTMTALGQTRK